MISKTAKRVLLTLVTIILLCMFTSELVSNHRVVHWAIGIGCISFIGILCVAKSQTTPDDRDRQRRRPLFGISIFNLFD